ncbi:hypothetical protein BJ166DRAFT_190398 [Pestalotiopsis sp. NC0098]|nr:hypothetical protein BJ166DRAFT_190398 [Pestalotiopsis sp. NC0098]
MLINLGTNYLPLWVVIFLFPRSRLLLASCASARSENSNQLIAFIILSSRSRFNTGVSEGHECGFGEVKVVHCSFCCGLATGSEPEQSILKRQFFGHGIFSSASLSAMLVWNHGYIHGEKWFALICRHDIWKLKEAVPQHLSLFSSTSHARANIRDANDHVLPHPGLYGGALGQNTSDHHPGE